MSDASDVKKVEGDMNTESNRNESGSPDARALALEVQRLAHDLNNSLMPLMMGFTLLRRKVADPLLAGTLTSMETSVHRAADLANALLALAGEHSSPEPGQGKQG